jgi:hypothetical protein
MLLLANVFGAPTGPRASAATRPGPMSPAAPLLSGASPSCATLPSTSNSRFIYIYINKFIGKKYVTSFLCLALNNSQHLLLLEELP